MSRLILSRKGFDSSFGGYPSPILPDGRIISLPIPDPDSRRTYSDYQIPTGETYAQLLARLGISHIHRGKSKIALRPVPGVHFDPDLLATSRPRLPQWCGLFGQASAAQGHLANQGVEKGDLFLFFGWFRKTTLRRDSLKFVGGHAHVVWGWLEVDYVVNVDRDQATSWMAEHPHVAQRSKFAGANNTLYVATRESSWLPGRSGAGVVERYHDRLRLTAPNEKRRSVWCLPIDFRRSVDISLTGQSPTAWRRSESGWTLQSACIGQEFVISANDGIKTWVQEMMSGAA